MIEVFRPLDYHKRETISTYREMFALWAGGQFLAISINSLYGCKKPIKVYNS